MLKMSLVFCLWLYSVGILMALPLTVLTVGSESYQVEVAADRESRQFGLMNRKHMDQDKGMLFVFEEMAKHSFWMKNTYIPLDLIWLDQDRKVIFYKRQAIPHDESLLVSPRPALYVLELNAGEIDRIGLKYGDVLHFNEEAFR